MTKNQIEDLEVELLFEALYRRFGYDFRNYARASIKRRILHCCVQCGINRISDLIPGLLHEEAFIHRLISALSVNVTEMFRNPSFYLEFRQKVVPILKTYPFINIWHAGCATGEEVYSMAILLQEEGFYDRTRIYGTDISDSAITKAKDGVFQMKHIDEAGVNYKKSGGKGELSDYYHARYDLIRMDSSLKKNMVFAKHNLAMDSVFAEIHVILCRNVMIYFNQELRNRVLNLFDASLVAGGFLALGNKETVNHSSVEEKFSVVAETNKIYRKRPNGGDK